MVLFIKNISIEGPGLFEELLKKEGFSLNIVDLSKGDKLPPLEECEAAIILGGPMSVYETNKYPFLTDEESFILQAVYKKIPILGICLGAQMLAKACSAKVIKSPVKELGWCDVVTTDEGKADLLFMGLEATLKVFQWHEDTFSIPQDGKLLVSGENCPNQAFRVGEYAWGLQFHPEVTSYMIKEWVDYYRQPKDGKEIIEQYFMNQDVYIRQAKLLCNNFTSIIAKRREELSS